MNRLLTHILIFAVVASCQTKSKQQQFVDFVSDPDNGITQKIRIGETDVIAKYLPYYQSTTAKSENYYYFDVSFSTIKGEKPPVEKLLYLNFDMQNDFAFLSGRDSIAPHICQRIENGLLGNYKYIIAFEKPRYINHLHDFTLFYRDKVFGLGVVAFVFKQKDLERIPVI